MKTALQATTSPRASAAQHFENDFSFYLPPPEEGEIATAQKVGARLFQRARSSIDLAAKRSAAAAKVLADWRAAIDKEVGSDNWRRVADRSRTERRSSLGLQDHRPGPVAPDRIAAAKKQAWNRSRELVGEAKFDTDAIRKIHAEANEKLLRALGRPAGKANPLEVVLEKEVPVTVLEGKTDPFFVKKPPYDSWYGLFEGYKEAGDFPEFRSNIEIVYSLDYPGPYITGQFGHYSRYENFDAGDFELMTLGAVTEVGFWYHPPQPGQRHVWTKIRCRKARADVYLDDESGISSSVTHMWSLLRFEVVEVPGLEGQTGDWYTYVPGDPDSTWYHIDWIAPDSVLWLHFVANFPPGWVYVGIGADDARQTLLNDVSTSQAMDTRFLAEEVWIEK